MAEKDAFSFEGAATLLRGGEPLPNSTLYYGGEVEELTKLSLYTLLSDRSLSNKTASSGVKDLKNSGSLVQSYYSHLEKKAGKWELQAATHSPQEFNPLPALNPLAQLEGLKEVEKQVTEEVEEKASFSAIPSSTTLRLSSVVVSLRELQPLQETQYTITIRGVILFSNNDFFMVFMPFSNCYS